MAPDRISYYNYAHLPERFLPQRAIDRLTLPSAEQKIRLLALIIEKLTAAGYLYIGMDHFVKPDDSLAVAQREGHLARNFQGYTIAKSHDLIGMGVSAISSLSDVYAQNCTDLESWYAHLDASHLPIAKGLVLTSEDKRRREVIQEILCYRSLDISRWETRTGLCFREHFADALDGLEDMASDGILTLSPERLTVNACGYPFLRNIAMLFDAYLMAHQLTGQARYSRAL
jgi:oxygen-independent coproporphyrinogen-3 oxidase